MRKMNWLNLFKNVYANTVTRTCNTLENAIFANKSAVIHAMLRRRKILLVREKSFVRKAGA